MFAPVAPFVSHARRYSYEGLCIRAPRRKAGAVSYIWTRTKLGGKIVRELDCGARDATTVSQVEPPLPWHVDPPLAAVSYARHLSRVCVSLLVAGVVETKHRASRGSPRLLSTRRGRSPASGWDAAI